jgi:hypothetical protein
MIMKSGQLQFLDIDDLLRPSKNLGMSASLSEAKLKCEPFQDAAPRSLWVSSGKSRASSASPSVSTIRRSAMRLGYEPEINAMGERLIWLEERWITRLPPCAAPARATAT